MLTKSTVGVGNGYWSFTSGSSTFAQPVYFENASRFNHVAVTAAVTTAPGVSPIITVADAETGAIATA